MRRPSLLHVGMTDEDTEDATKLKLIPFVYDSSTRFIIGFRHEYVTIWDSDGAVVDTLILSFPTSPGWPGTDFDIDEISYAQVNDVLFVAHSNMPPIIIKRMADGSWEFSRCMGSADGLIAGFGKNYWPPVLDESVSIPDATDVQEGWTIAKDTAVTASWVFGGIYKEGMTNVENGPFPGAWRLYTGTTAFTGTIVIAGSDAWNGTFRNLYTVTNASVGAMTLRQEWFHHYAFLKITVTRSTGTATFELRHVGSIAAPSVWASHDIWFPVGGNPNLFSSPAGFADWSVGEQLQISWKRLKQQVDVTVLGSTADEFKVSDELYVLGKWELYTTGIWEGDVFVESKESSGAWRTIRHLTGKKDQNWSISGDSVGETLRVRVVKYDGAASSSGAKPRFTLVATDGISAQWLQVLAKSSDSKMSFNAMPGFDYAQAGQATTSVYRGAFSPSQGYPSSVCIHDQRVYFGGTEKRPTTIWASSVNDLFNFRRTGFDDGGFMFEIASNEGNPIQWMVPASRGILLGTAGDEWLLDGADTGITPTNISARRQSRIGSAPLQAIPAAGSTIFVQRGSMHLQEYQFAWETQQFQAVDLTELVKHLTTSGIRAMAFSQNPEPMLWCVMLDGSLLTCTYNRAQEVIAWAKHTTQGTFESVAVTYGDTANADDVWFVVLRNGTRRLEKIDVAFWANLYNGGRLYHMDGAVTKTGAAFTSVTGLTHLNGLTAKVTANGIAQTDAVVSGGSVTVPTGTTHAVVGLPFTSELQPMPFDIQLQTGTTQSRKMHTPSLAVRLYRTDAAKYADSAGGTLYPLKISAGTTGLVRLSNVGRMNDSCEVYFRSTGALPLNLVTVVPSVNVYGD